MTLRVIVASVLLLGLTSCSVFGENGVESAPYKILQSDNESKIEVRQYESMVLVSASMEGDSRNSAFRKLFKYISGNNEGEQEIAMTAPVFMGQDSNASPSSNKGNAGTEIAMTAPVFMGEKDGQRMMSFVMPKSFTLATTPVPLDSTLQLSEVSDYKVVAIQFSGTLSKGNVETHTERLMQWISLNNFEAIGVPITAGYNGPMTLPWLRRNEVLIEVQ